MSSGSRRGGVIGSLVGVIILAAAVGILCGTGPVSAREASLGDASARDEEARSRYLAARSDFMELLRTGEQQAEASQLSLAMTYFRSAEMRADRGYYSAALLDIQRAINELQRVLGSSMDEGLARTAERQLTRLEEILAEAERLSRDSETDTVRRALARAYREAADARRAYDEERYRDSLNLGRRAMQRAQDALRLARRGGIDATDRLQERLKTTLAAMDELVAKAGAAPPPPDKPDIPRIVSELQEMAARAHEAAHGGHVEMAFRLSDRAIRLARLVLREAGLHDQLPPDRLLQELEGLTNLVERGRVLAAERPEPTAVRLLGEAEEARTAAQEAVHRGDFVEAEKRIREGTEKAIRALGLLGPTSGTLEQHALEALQQLRGRLLPAAEDVLQQHPDNIEAANYLSRARYLADQAETQLAARQPLAALGSIRIAVEFTIQAVSRAAGTAVSLTSPPE